MVVCRPDCSQGPVLVHALHKNSGAVARDLILRVLLPAAGIVSVWSAVSLERCNLAQSITLAAARMPMSLCRPAL